MTTLQIWITIIYGCIGVLYGFFSLVVVQKTQRPKNTEWYMILLIFLYGVIFWPLNIIIQSFRKGPQF